MEFLLYLGKTLRRIVTYARFLLEYAFNAPVSGLGNHFYYPSFLWQRIGMLYQRKNAPWALSRYGVTGLFIAMVTFMVASCERIGDSKMVSGNVVERLVRGTVVDEGGERLPGAVVTVVGSTHGTTTDAQGSFSITVPEGARLYAGFIGYAGQETNPLSEGVNEVHFRLKPELRAGLLKGKSVASVRLAGNDRSRAAMALETPPGEKKIYTVVEKQPEFPGGGEALSAYLGSNLKYPEAARRAGVEGKVYLQFVVTDTGQMADVMVLQGIGHGCDEEAVRIVKAMPGWKPGSQDGKALNVRYVLPVRFELEK